MNLFNPPSDHHRSPRGAHDFAHIFEVDWRDIPQTEKGKESMNYKQLDRALRQLEPMEEYYRETGGNLEYQMRNRAKRRGAFYQMDYEPKYKNDLFSFQAHPYIYISRHIRYVPVFNHKHDWVELCYMYSGSCEQTINDSVHLTLKEGQMLIIDTDAYHSIGNTGENDILINMLLKKEFFTEIFFSHFSEQSVLLRFLLNAISEKANHDNYILFPSEDSTRIGLFMRELMIEFLAPRSPSSVDVVDNLINLIFLELAQVYQSEAMRSGLQVPENKVFSILRYIQANYRSCTLTSTAEFFGMNPNYLSTLLKKSTNYTFKELVQGHRFAYVTTMLQNTQVPVDEVIFQAGYENTTYFYKKFKEKYGCSPKQYRIENS